MTKKLSKNSKKKHSHVNKASEHPTIIDFKENESLTINFITTKPIINNIEELASSPSHYNQNDTDSERSVIFEIHNEYEKMWLLCDDTGWGESDSEDETKEEPNEGYDVLQEKSVIINGYENKQVSANCDEMSYEVDVIEAEEKKEVEFLKEQEIQFNTTIKEITENTTKHAKRSSKSEAILPLYMRNQNKQHIRSKDSTQENNTQKKIQCFPKEPPFYAQELVDAETMNKIRLFMKKRWQNETSFVT